VAIATGAAGKLTNDREGDDDMAVATESELDDSVDVDDGAPNCEAVHDDDASDSAGGDNSTDAPEQSVGMSSLRRTMLLGIVIVVTLATLLGWLGFRSYQLHQAQAQRSLFLQVAKQGALNLTTIDWQHADADVQRILDGATGQFQDDFTARSGPFVEIVKKAKSVTVGTVTEAGLESVTADTAQALVAVFVTTSNAGPAEAEPRAWRLRVFVQKVGDQAKVSNVEFVP
jgi:Mce-associated membrane protein